MVEVGTLDWSRHSRVSGLVVGGLALTLGQVPFDCDNRSITRAGGIDDPGRILALVNEMALGPLAELEVVMLQKRAVEAPQRSGLAQSI